MQAVGGNVDASSQQSPYKIAGHVAGISHSCENGTIPSIFGSRIAPTDQYSQ